MPRGMVNLDADADPYARLALRVIKMALRDMARKTDKRLRLSAASDVLEGGLCPWLDVLAETPAAYDVALRGAGGAGGAGAARAGPRAGGGVSMRG